MEKIIQMTSKKRVVLRPFEYFWHYSVCFFILNGLLGIIYLDFMKNSEFVLKQYYYILFILLIIMFYIQRRRLKFKIFKTNLSKKDIKDAIKETAIELNWIIDYQNNQITKAHREFDISTGGSWGEMITIIYKDNHIYVNSICNPNGLYPSVLSYGWNKKNINTFFTILNNP